MFDWILVVVAGTAKWFLGEGGRSLIMLAGLLVAIASVVTSRQVARRKQCADLLFAARTDEQLQEGYRILFHYGKSETRKVENLAKKSVVENDTSLKKEANLIIYLLNHFESVSVGVFNGIYDERMLKEAWFTNMINTYDLSEPFIREARKTNGTQTTFQEFERLCCRWKDHPLENKPVKRKVK